MDLFRDKVVIITGSSGGIGGQTATQFAGQGAKVVLAGRDKQRLDLTRHSCEEAGATEDKILVVESDVTKNDDMTRIIQATIDKFGSIDILVNNAGQFLTSASLVDTEAEEILDMFRVNTLSAFNMTKLAMPHLVRSRGNVVNVSSLYGHRAVPCYLPLAISKAAMDQLTRCLALEYAPKGVRVNSVNPGHTATPLFRTSGCTDEEGEAKFFEAIGAMYPLGRVGKATEVAEAILFLASDKASFTTGMLLNVDGGMAFCMEGALAAVK